MGPSPKFNSSRNSSMQTTQWYIDVNEGMLVEAVELA
tara:strand:- start:241 stop:351 length:111 start_codon:yes stop_codon:yes gene_type:complete